MNTIPNARQFAVLGLGRFGSALARQLYALGKEVLAVDTDEQKVDDIAEYVTHAMAVDCLDEPAVRQIGLENFDVVIVGVGEMETSILATLICKEIGVKYVVAKAQSVQHRKVLEKIGADMVVFPEMEAGCKLGNLLASPTVVELAEIAPNFKVVEVEVPSVWADKSLTELKIRQKYLLTVLMVSRGGKITTSPSGEFILQANDKIVLCGEHKDLVKFSKTV